MTIKVVSLNVWAGKLLPGVVDFLKEQQADVVLLQEVTNARDKTLAAKHRALEVLKTELRYPYQDFVQSFVYRGPDGLVPQGSAVLTKFPIRQSSGIFFNEPDRAYYEDIPADWPLVPRLLQRVDLQTPAGELNVFNIQGVWDLNGDDYSDARRAMTDTILDAIMGRPKVIFGGDSNASLGNPLWERLNRHLKSAFPNGLKTTFNMRRKTNPGYATAAVDVVYVSPNIKVLGAECLDIDISDHLPLVVTLDIP
jgi:endonuclease/exonuclease/phosphatase family metal-dependent hydrolase